MDFMSDALFDGRPFRLLAIVDCCTRDGLGTLPRANFRAFHVDGVLDPLVAARANPRPFGSTTS
jgi:putative transposase